MKVYKAFLYTELLFIKRHILVLFFSVFLCVSVFYAPYLNQFTFSLIEYTPEFSNILAIILVIVFSTAFSSILTVKIIIYEKINGVHFFLFNNGINKLIYLLSKFTFSFIFLIINLSIPVTLYLNLNIYNHSMNDLILMIVFPVLSIVILTMLSILSSLLFNETKNIMLCSYLTFLLIDALLFSSTLLYDLNIYLVSSVLAVLAMISFVITYFILNNKESKINISESRI